MEWNAMKLFTAISKQSPRTIYKHFEKIVYTESWDQLCCSTLDTFFSATLRKNRLRHLDRLCTKCHQVLLLRLRSISRSVISWLSFDFATVDMESVYHTEICTFSSRLLLCFDRVKYHLLWYFPWFSKRMLEFWHEWNILNSNFHLCTVL